MGRPSWSAKRAEAPAPDYQEEEVRFSSGSLSLAGTLVQPLTAGIQPSSWTWVGPGNIGGRVRSIVMHPTTTGTMWAGSVGGGGQSRQKA